MAHMTRWQVELVEAARRRGHSQTEMARRLNLSPSYVGNLISGYRSPGSAVLLAVEAEYGIPPRWLREEARAAVAS